MEVNLQIALNILPGGKLIKFGLFDEFFLMTTDVTDESGLIATPPTPVLRTLYNPTTGALSQVAAEEVCFYFPYAAITGTLG